MITIGDSKIPPGGVYDEGDGFDAPPGTMDVSSRNVIPGRNKFSWTSRGAFVKDKDLPSVGNGITANAAGFGDLEFIKVKCVRRFKVTRPSEKLITFYCGVYRFLRNSAAQNYTYMLRFFMSPDYSAGAFGPLTSWRDITPYYLDLYFTSKGVTRNAANSFYIVYTDPVGIYSPDLYNAYAYLEDTTNFTSPQVHTAEGDKIISNALTKYDEEGTSQLYFYTESDHPTMWANTHDIVRIHKNLTIGKIPYSQLCSQNPTFFDDYTITAKEFDEGLVVSVHTGNSGRASFTFYLKYEKKILFGDGAIWSAWDYCYNNPDGDGNDRVYDKHLVYGFPGYDWIIKNGANTFNGGSLYNYTGSPSAPPASSANNVSGTYNAVNGSIKTQNLVAGDVLSRRLYRLDHSGGANTPDLSISLDDFIFQEFDVHGRWGAYKSFDNGDYVLGNQCFLAGGSARNNYPEVDALADAGEKTSEEEAWNAGSNTQFFHSTQMAWHNGYRIGLHNENILSIANPYTTKVLIPVLAIPAGFNRFMTAAGLGISKNYTFASLAQVANTTEILNEKLCFYDDMTSGWDFHLCELNGSGNLLVAGFFYAKAFRFDQKKYGNVNIGGNHLDITSNPGYQRKIVATDKPHLSVDGDLIGNVVYANYPTHVMKDDISWGAKALAFLRDRVFTANIRYQEYQFGIAGTLYETTNQIFYSRIGEYGGQFHLFNDAVSQLQAKEIGSIVSLEGVSVLGGDLANQNLNNLLVIGEEGYIYVDLADNNEANFRPYFNKGTGCVSRKTLITENGIAFWAGNDGIYMFVGQEAKDITELGDSKINKTWRAIPKADKQNAVGMFFRSRKWYAVSVVNGGEEIFILFDLEEQKIFIFSHTPQLAAEPSGSASNFAQTGATETSVSGSFTGGAGASGHIVLRYTGVSPSLPVDRVAYSPGDPISGDTTVVANVAGTTFTDIGLTVDSTYKYAIISYNGDGSSRNYKTSSPLTGTGYTLPDEPSAQPTNFNVVDVGVAGGGDFNTLITFNNVSDADGFIVTRRPAGQPEIIPVDGKNYSDEQTVSGQTKCVHSGPWADFSSGYTQDGVTLSNIKYIYMVYSYKENNGVRNYKTIGAPTKNLDFGTPDAQPTSLVLTKVGSDVKVEFTTDADASFYIVVHNNTSTFNDPVDGTTYSDDQVYGSNSVRVVHAGPYSDFAGGILDNGPFGGGSLDYYRVYSYNKKSSPNYLETAPLSGSIAL